MIHIDHVSYRYNSSGKENLKNITLDIDKGQCVLVCGESGSGKTTLSRLINGLIPQYFEGQLQGTVTVNGLKVSEAELYETARVTGSVFQNPRSQFFCVDTTSELAFGCENQGMPEQEILDRIDRVVREMKLQPLMNRSIFELSGGEKQKIACGSVSVTDPEVLVLDEPTSNLDRKAIEELRKTVALWKSKGKTVVIAEHRLYWLKDLCDRVIVMREGQILLDEPMNRFIHRSEKEREQWGLRSLDLRLHADPVPFQCSERLILKNFNAGYQNRQVLHIPELKLPQGGIIALIGDNGAGKSTLASCLCGLKKSGGTVKRQGENLDHRGLLKKSVLVMQDVNHQLFCDTVAEEVRLGMKPEAEPYVGQVLESLDLADLSDRHPMSLSGGQKQRVAVASALLMDKEILIFDEPTSGLDERHMQQTADWIRSLKNKKTVLIVTHDPELIFRCCTHVLQLEQGEVKQFYPMDENGQQLLMNYFTDTERRENSMKSEKPEEKSIASWIMEFASQKKSNYIYSMILAFLGSVCHMAPYFVMAHVITLLLQGNRDFNTYIQSFILMALFWTLRVLFHGFSTRLSHIATFNVLGNIRKQALIKLEKMPLGDVRLRGSGELKNILVERIDSIETTLAHIIPEMTGNLSVTLLILIYLFIVDWRMALVSLITLPLGLACYMFMMIGYDKYYARTVKATKELNDTAVEYISGIEVIKVFGKAKSSYEKFVAAAKEGAASYVDWMRTCNIPFTFALNIMPATLVSVLPVGGYFVMKGTLPVADFILITILSMGLITPIITCMSYSDDLAKLNTVLGEVTSVLTAKEMDRPQTSRKQVEGAAVELDNVRFAYDEEEVLHGISARFEEGTVNALVGPSGGGKSTIAKLIASFWDVKDGAIRIGNTDIRDLSQEETQKKIAYVSQDNFLFDDTVRENIRMGRLDATDEEVEQAARDCGCYDFIMGLEKGFDTVVGTGGSHLSGGEQQRISIARAMLKEAPIVILDEATAYTDPENEALIQKSVARLVKGKTLIVIAHRLSTVTDADQIVVINHGQVEGSGKHEELLESCPLYRSLWEAHISSRDRVDGGEQHV